MKRYQILSSVLFIFALCHCSSHSDSGASVALHMTANSTVSSITKEESSLFSSIPRTVLPWVAGNTASNEATELQSLKYVFGFISICEDLTINGSAFSGTTNCLQIYNGPTVGDGSSSAITPSTLSSYADSQIDMMDATSRAKVNQSKALTSTDAHAYNYAVMNWYTPIAAKGCVTATNGMICTKNTGATYSGSTTTTTANLTSTAASEASETIEVSANGGSFFKFQNPFTITAADVSNNTSFTVDLVFNPKGVLSGRLDSNADGNIRGSVGSMYIPMLNIAPVPRKGAQTTKKETYITNSDCGAAKYRVELYYNSDDSTTILGATGNYMYDSTTSGASIMQADMGGKVTTISAAGDGSLTLKTPSASSSQNWISALTRGADGTWTLYSDGSGGGATSCAYTFSGTTTVN